MFPAVAIGIETDVSLLLSVDDHADKSGEARNEVGAGANGSDGPAIGWRRNPDLLSVGQGGRGLHRLLHLFRWRRCTSYNEAVNCKVVRETTFVVFRLAHRKKGLGHCPALGHGRRQESPTKHNVRHREHLHPGVENSVHI